MPAKQTQTGGRFSTRHKKAPNLFSLVLTAQSQQILYRHGGRTKKLCPFCTALALFVNRSSSEFQPCLRSPFMHDRLLDHAFSSCSLSRTSKPTCGPSIVRFNTCTCAHWMIITVSIFSHPALPILRLINSLPHQWPRNHTSIGTITSQYSTLEPACKISVLSKES